MTLWVEQLPKLRLWHNLSRSLSPQVHHWCPVVENDSLNLTFGKIYQLVVPGAGVEPALSCDNEILSLACLPISPPGHRARSLLMSVQLLNVKCYKG